MPASVFGPRSVAVVGASSNVDSPGHDYVKALVVSGFKGPVYPISPRVSRRSDILGGTAMKTARANPT